MFEGKKVVVIMPAYNAERTLEKTYLEIPKDIVDEVILCDDFSRDRTVEVAEKLGLTIIRHEKNKGYGANQKACYDAALNRGADIIIMLHPDYQYTPRLVTAMASIIAGGVYPVVFGSRILGGGAIQGGMPRYKYLANRFLTLTQNIMLNQKLSEYHTGYRAYSSEVLKSIHYHANSDGFLFDNQMIVQIFHRGFSIGEITCPTKYFPEASSINFRASVKYGFGVIATSFLYLLEKTGLVRSALFMKKAS